MKREWNDKNHRFTLHSHIDNFCEDNNEIQRELDFVHYELPNKHNRVGRIIKYITSNQTRMIYSITHIQGGASQRDDFETAANLLLLTAPNNSGTLKQS